MKNKNDSAQKLFHFYNITKLTVVVSGITWIGSINLNNSGPYGAHGFFHPISNTSIHTY